MDIFIRSDVHSTEVRLRISELPHIVSKNQARKLRNELCGQENCDCGVVAGPQEYRVTPIEHEGRQTWRIEWWDDGEGPYPEGERALREAGKRHRMNFTTGEVAEMLGLSSEQVRKLKVDPAGTYVNRRQVVCALYSRIQFLKLYTAPEVEEARERRRGPVDWISKFKEEYGTPESALSDAADYLFRLNRYAKRAMTADTREHIYSLKDRLVRHLYHEGHCERVFRHRVRYEAQECWGCWGEGCSRCGNTGQWKPAEWREFVCFHFVVDGKRYCWHQPAEHTKWLPEEVVNNLEDGEHDWVPGEIKEVSMSGQFPRAYALIRWVLGAL